MNEHANLIGKLYDNVHLTNVQLFHFWHQNTFLHRDWWVALGLTILPWVAWWKMIEKDNAHRLLYAGFFVIIVCCWFDFLGVASGLWYYTAKLVPTIPAFIPFDLCIFPVLVMLLIQYKPHVSPMLKSLIFGIFSAMIAEPLFTWAGFYVPVHWRHVYSLPIYAVIYLMAHWFSTRTFCTHVKP